MAKQHSFSLGIFLSVVSLALIVPAMLAGVSEAEAETARIYGLQGWFAQGDTIQFIGDAQVLSVPPQTPDCEGWDEDCALDNGFAFREVSGVDVSECAIADSSTTCYVFGVVCCYWMGACSSQPCDSSPAPDCDDSEYEEICGNNCYCMSIWEVQSFNAAPGDALDGCYEIEMICDGNGADCDDGDVCGTKVTWY